MLKPLYRSYVYVAILICFVLVVAIPLTSGAEVGGDLCPPGQVTHRDRVPTLCCLPVDCPPKFQVKYCSRNGTRDVCEACPRNFALFRRTSSFSVMPCHVFPLQEILCKQLPGNPRASEQDIKDCFCDLERGDYYMRPQVPLGPTSYCQPFRYGCRKGYQPTQRGVCEPCEENTVQDVEDKFYLCRPQKNCTAMRLKTEEMGNTTKETVCAKPPSPPSHPPPVYTHHTTTPAGAVVKTTRTMTVVSTKPHGVHPSVAPSIERQPSTGGFNIALIIVLCVGGVVVLAMMVMLTVCARRRGWCRTKGTCPRHCNMENGTYPVTRPTPCDDNASNDSCCACTDSCLATSKPSTSGKSGACPSCKDPTMLQGYVNGKCDHMLDHSLMSEPLYNSISHDGSKMSDGNLGTYQNVKGIHPTLLTQHDFTKPSDFDYNYPSKVCLPSVDSEEDDSLKKDEFRAGRNSTNKGKESEEFKETDPLLPNFENFGSSAPPPLRGILRNGNNSGRGLSDGREVGGGNRPNLSILLNSHEGSSLGSCDGGVAVMQEPNLPHLSQLVSVSAPHGVVSRPQPTAQIPLQQAPSQQETAAEPTQHVHELPPELQRHLLQQQRQQQQREGSTLVMRPAPNAPNSQPQVHSNLVQMDELKPVMSLPPPSPSPTSPPAATPVMTEKSRPDSPARIDPSQQKQIRSGNSPETKPPAKISTDSRKLPTETERKLSAEGETFPTEVRKLPTESGKLPTEEKESETGAGAERQINEETFRKQALPLSSPTDDETSKKSVGGSSGLGDSLDFSDCPLSMPSEDGRRSRSMYRRSNSEVSRSVSPQLPLPPSRSISSPGDKTRPYAVVKPMQSDQSLNALSSSPDLSELTQPLDVAGRQFPLHSMRSQVTQRQSSQESSDDPDEETEEP